MRESMYDKLYCSADEKAKARFSRRFSDKKAQRLTSLGLFLFGRYNIPQQDNKVCACLPLSCRVESDSVDTCKDRDSASLPPLKRFSTPHGIPASANTGTIQKIYNKQTAPKTLANFYGLNGSLLSLFLSREAFVRLSFQSLA